MSSNIGNRVARLGFWYTLHEHFLEFESLLIPNNSLTSEDRLALKKVHTLVYQAYQITKERKINHDKNF